MGPQETDHAEDEGQVPEAFALELERVELEEATERLLIEWVGKRVVDGMSFCDADVRIAALRCAKIVKMIRAEAARAVDEVLGERERREGP